MTGITANGAAAYIAALEKSSDSAIRELQLQIETAQTSEERRSLEDQIKAVREEFNAPDAPFVLATIGFGGWKMERPEALMVANAQLAVSGESGKYQAAANADAWKAYHGKKDTAANMADLKASMDSVRGLLQTGPTVDYTSFVSSAYANSQGITKGTDIGNTRFWTDAEIKR